jgi:mercuric ion transport protein
MKYGAFLGASALAALVSSLCCVLPIAFALTGSAVVGASAFFESLRPYFLVGTFGLLALGFYYAYRPSRDACEPGSACAIPVKRRTARITLWLVAAVVAALAAFPYYSGPVAEFLLSRR